MTLKATFTISDSAPPELDGLKWDPLPYLEAGNVPPVPVRVTVGKAVIEGEITEQAEHIQGIPLK